MRLFAFDDGPEGASAEALSQTPVDNEWQLESWLHANPDLVLDEPLLIFGRQYALATGIPDLLALDRWGNVVVIELKRGKSGSGSASEETILSQPQNYASDLSQYEYEDLAGIYDEYRASIEAGDWDISESVTIANSLEAAYETVFGGSANPGAFNEYQRMVILAEEITPSTESNARYLLEQGLNVQCVETQWFDGRGEGQLVTTATVVDYPPSRVKPATSAADFSSFTNRLESVVASRLEGIDGIAEVTSTPTQVRVFPTAPDGLRYDVYVPGAEAGQQGNIRLNASGVDERKLPALREALEEHADELDAYVVEQDRVMDIVHREPQVSIQSRDGDAIEALAEEIVTLVETYQPVLVSTFGGGE